MTKDNNELDPMSIAQQAWMDEKEELTQGFEGKIKSLERTIESMMENHERLIASMAGLMQGQNAELESTSGQSMPSQLDWGEGSEYKPKWEPVVKPPKKKSKSKKNRRIAIKEPESESESESESDDDTATRGDTNTADITFGSGNTANKILQAFKILTRKPKSERDEDSTAENSRSAKSYEVLEKRDADATKAARTVIETRDAEATKATKAEAARAIAVVRRLTIVAMTYQMKCPLAVPAPVAYIGPRAT
eukprot:CAMPEP_0194240144 /NCGR_PEP_ID=MMETSP0158-20130606/6399_1 /TAXON_ID=33649 /ORGANISM="Thalassionema nitzschioides, Strain L26-B" /LENGTH=249 /DNA_ID=CAMNT_0038974783 /DNA_START=36 /DNA_END=786 /DNA_ORIENTATION=+